LQKLSVSLIRSIARPGDVPNYRLEHLDERNRVLHVPKRKTG
jgi:hypothetical protein